ncbi:MAG: WG repeat-containing protein [Bacteroidota bacterium]
MRNCIIASIIIYSFLLCTSKLSAQRIEIFKNNIGKFGLIDNSGNVIIEAKYKNLYELDLLNAGICDCGTVSNTFILDNGSKHAIYSTLQKKLLTDFLYDTIYPISTDDLGIVKKGNKIGLIRVYSGKLITQIEMDSIDFSRHWVAEWGDMRNYVIESNYVCFIKNKKKLLYNLNGKLIISGYNEKDFIFVKNNNEIIPVKRSKIGVFENGKAKVKINGKEFYIDEKGYRVN